MQQVTRKPIVLVPACVRQIGEFPYHAAQLKYVEAVVTGADCAPLVLPALSDRLDLETMLELCDGILLTGAASNVHPSHYEQTVFNPELPQDLARDTTVLPMLRAAIKRGIPVIGICRGFQELNVALGGSLHQAVHVVEGHFDHREDPDLPLEEQYGPAHPIFLTEGGMLSTLLGGVAQIRVNSLHGQGIDRLAPGILVEAVAEDGLIEAFSVPASPGFALAVQWHPEWRISENPDSMKMFGAFGQACRDYQAQKQAKQKGQGGA